MMNRARTLPLLPLAVIALVTGCPDTSTSTGNDPGGTNGAETAGTTSAGDPANDAAADAGSTANDATTSDGAAAADDSTPPATTTTPATTSDMDGQSVGDETAEDEEPAVGESFMIEPDDFDDGTPLTDVDARVTLTTASDDNQPMANTPVTASDDGFGFAPTGEKVFGHANIQFFNNDRRLRLDFTSPVQGVQIQFAGGTFFETEIGRLEAYDEGGNLLEQAVTEPKGAGVAETLSIIRESAEIAWAVAYVAADEGSFGRFDALVLTLPVAEP